MIAYTIVGTNDLARAGAFYDALLEEWAVSRVMESDRMIYWMAENGGPGFAVAIPFDEQSACIGNGSMIALAASSPEQVDRIYQKAIELGGSCEGKPGKRDVTYAGYFRDLDGNKLNVISY